MSVKGSFIERLHIALDSAKGILYLHTNAIFSRIIEKKKKKEVKFLSEWNKMIFSYLVEEKKIWKKYQI